MNSGDFKHVVITPAELNWVDNPRRPGQRTAILFGDPSKAGPYTQRVRFTPNTPNPPHTHPDNRQVTIVSVLISRSPRTAPFSSLLALGPFVEGAKNDSQHLNPSCSGR